MDSAEITIVIINLLLGTICAYPLAKYLMQLKEETSNFGKIYIVLLGVYFIECVAFSAGMATNIFTIGLSFLWGILFSNWVSRFDAAERKLIKAVLIFSLYTCLPAISSLSILLMMSLAGWSIFSSTAGLKFGIPAFVPWPANTIFGFFLIVALSALVFKTIITIGEVSLVLYFRDRKNKHI